MAEAPGQLEVEGVEVDVADLIEALGGPGVGQGLGDLAAPVLVLGLQGPELGQGRGPPRRPGLRPGRTLLSDGDPGRAALAEAALPFGAPVFLAALGEPRRRPAAELEAFSPGADGASAPVAACGGAPDQGTGEARRSGAGSRGSATFRPLRVLRRLPRFRAYPAG